MGSGPPQEDGPFLERSNCSLCWQCPTCFPPKLAQFAFQCRHITEMVKAQVRATRLSSVSKGAASWGHFPWEQSSLAATRVFKSLGGWSCLDLMDGSIARAVTSRPGESRGLEMPEAMFQKCLWDIVRMVHHQCCNSGKNKLCAKSESAGRPNRRRGGKEIVGSF